MTDKNLFGLIFLGICVVIGYNAFLIHRDAKLFDAYKQATPLKIHER